MPACFIYLLASQTHGMVAALMLKLAELIPSLGSRKQRIQFAAEQLALQAQQAAQAAAPAKAAGGGKAGGSKKKGKKGRR